MAAEIRWIDTHAHLTDVAFDDDREAVIERARAAGVRKIIVNAWDLASIDGVLEFAARVPEVYCAIGIHPSDCADYSDAVGRTIKQYAEQADRYKIVAIGEVGMDYHYDGIDKEMQQHVFREQIRIAQAVNLPLVVHERDAHEDALTLLLQAEADGILRQAPGVFHCYSGSGEFAKRLIPMGWYFGFDGPLTYKNGKKARAVVEVLPRDRVLIETDSPYLAPDGYRGKRNESAYLPLIGSELARLWDLSLAETAEQLWQNSHTLFPGLHDSRA